MQLDFSRLDPAESYRWLTSMVTPRPIAWVSTQSVQGISNLAPFSFFQVISDQPPILLVSVGRRPDGRLKDTVRNVQATGELVIHLVDAAHAEAMNASSASFEYGISEFTQVGISSVPSIRVKPPRVTGATVAFECELAQIMPYPADAPQFSLLFARVLLAHIDDAVMADARHVDAAKLDLVGRLSGSDYATTRDRFAMKRPP